VRALAGEGVLNTVDHNWLEFSVPRSMRLGPALAVFVEIDAIRHREQFEWVEGLPSPEIVERANSRRRDTKNYIAVQINSFLGNGEEAIRYYAEIEPREGPVAWRRARAALADVAWNLLVGGKPADAAALAELLLQGDPHDDGALRLVAEAAHRAGDDKRAREALVALAVETKDKTIRDWANENLRRLGQAAPAS